MRRAPRVLVSTLLALIVALSAGPTLARSPADTREDARQLRGRPRVVLDRLTLPDDLGGAAAIERHLRKTLKRETRRADWGAGRGSTITYRFELEELTVTEQGGVVRVSCTALGKLPKGKVARSHLTFSGAPSRRKEIVERVLEIVARGVIGRLAELERIRRGGR